LFWEDLKHRKNGVVLPTKAGLRLQGQTWWTWLPFAGWGLLIWEEEERFLTDAM